METRIEGSYLRQPGGYAAYLPPTLPLRKTLDFSAGLQSVLSQADRALGRLDGAIDTLPNPDLFVAMYVRKEATLSSQIEGTQASLGDVLRAEANMKDTRRPDDVDEPLNYVRAMNYGLARLSDIPISMRLLREIHAKLLDGVRGQHRDPGNFRSIQNWIGPEGVAMENAVFVPPPPGKLADYLGNLETYINAEDDLPYLMKVGIAHAQFETLHPFLDGNGRLGRLLIAFMLVERKVLVRPVLYLSHFFKQNRTEYYERLQATRDRDDWEGWLRFFLTAVATVANEATEVSRGIVRLREGHRDLILAESPKAAGNSLRLLEELYAAPYFDIRKVSTLLEVTPQGAKLIVDRMVRLGIVEEVTGQGRNRVFAYAPYLSLFGA